MISYYHYNFSLVTFASTLAGGVFLGVILMTGAEAGEDARTGEWKALIAASDTVEAAPPDKSQLLWEGAPGDPSWWRAFAGSGPDASSYDLEFGEKARKTAGQGNALAARLVTTKGGVLRITGMSGRMVGIEISPAVWASFLRDGKNQKFVLGIEYQLKNLDLPGYYICPRISHGGGRGEQRFFSKWSDNNKDWTRSEFIFSSKPGDTLPVRIAHHGNSGEWLIRRVYLRKAVVDESFPWPLAEGEESTPLVVGINSKCATPANPRLHGMNSNLSRTLGSFDSEGVARSVSEAKLGSLRFPSGTQSNWYLWERDGWPDTFPKEAPAFVRQTSAALKRNRNGVYGYDGYVQLAKKTGFEPVIVLNMLESPDSLARWLERMDATGLKPRYFEFGNEIYDPRQGGATMSTGADYVEVCRRAAATLRKTHPDARFALASQSRRTRTDGDAWNRALAGAGFADGVVLHTYTHAFGVPFNREMTAAMLFPELRIAGELLEKQAMFGALKIWNTEWGINAPPVNPGGTQLGALQTACYMLSLVKWQEHYEVACLHSLGGSSEFSPVALPSALGEKTTYMRRPFFTMQLLASLFADGVVWHETKIEENLPPVAAMRGRAMAQAARLKDGALALVVVNRLPVAKPLQITIDGRPLAGRRGKLHSLSAPRLSDAAEVPLGDSLITTRAFDADTTLPPWSVNRIDIPES
jgi:hypothetical protein